MSLISHHLIFVSKHFKGYEIMRDIMANESSGSPQGVATFEYNPANERQPFLFEFSRPLDDLGTILLHDFSGRSLTMLKIYQQHSVDRPYTKKNYKQALLHLEEHGRILASPARNRRRRDTFADRVTVTFPD